MKKLLILLIDAYRLLLSPFFGTQCRFYPTCSAYAREAIDTHGAIKGSWLTVKRLGKCHPWHEGGIDNVPPRRSNYPEAQLPRIETQKMQPSVPAHEIYRTHMADAKLRILTAEKILASPKPATGYTSLDMEFCFLQIRRVIESITFAAMVREELRYVALRGLEKSANKKDHGDATKDWQAPEILKRLVSLSPHALPIPHKDGKESSPGLIHFDRQEIEVNHGRLIDLYKQSGAFLHAKNPIGRDFNSLVEAQRENYVEAPTEVRRSLKFLRQLLWQHAAITLEPAGQDDPRTPASPKYVWLVSFGSFPGEEVNIVIGEAIASNDSLQQGPEPAEFKN